MVGELRRQTGLGTGAVYRVCGCTDTVVQVEVVHAPGLGSGQRFTFTRAAVANMTVVSNLAESDTPPPRR